MKYPFREAWWYGSTLQQPLGRRQREIVSSSVGIAAGYCFRCSTMSKHLSWQPGEVSLKHSSCFREGAFTVIVLCITISLLFGAFVMVWFELNAPEVRSGSAADFCCRGLLTLLPLLSQYEPVYRPLLTSCTLGEFHPALKETCLHIWSVKTPVYSCFTKAQTLSIHLNGPVFNMTFFHSNRQTPSVQLHRYET